MKLSSKYFDEIRSKKTEKESKRDCESLGCKESGDYIAKSKNGKVNYYCIEHIRLYNKNYNFFSDMSEDEIIDFQVSSMTGHRPTWKMSSNGSSSQKDFFESNTNTKFEDPFGFFKDEKGKSNLKNKNSFILLLFLSSCNVYLISASQEMAVYSMLIFFTALKAAIPFKSEPEDAAVAEVLAILLVSVSVILILSKLTPNSWVITPRTLVCRP